MSHQWGTSGGAETGILRNKNRSRAAGGEVRPEELLVFGYACKLFRDDEKALHIDQGKHLIPWMGEESLRIDRYDGRGTLSDIQQYEASKEGYDTTRWLGLSESQRKLEELCDSERYYSLEINEEEEEMYKEEEAKRKLTNAFQYSYNENGSSAEPPEPPEPDGIPTVPEFNEDEQPYVPSPLLDVPVDISTPKTIKEYARIEKTALFVCRQGQQMEILIKTKQSENPQFGFLTQTDPLYKFYRHVLSAFKNGRYQPQYIKKNEDKQEPANLDEPNEESHYLHPSLVSSKPDQPQVPLHAVPPPTPVLPYQPSADCTYSQLVTRIQGTTGGIATPEPPPQVEQPPPVQQLTVEQQHYYQYYYLQQYYDYYRQTVQSGENGAQYAHLPQIFHQLDHPMQSFVHQLAFVQYVHHCQQQPQPAAAAQAIPVQQGNNSYAQIVSNLNKDGVNAYAANVPELPLPYENTKSQAEDQAGKNEIKHVVEVKKSLMSLAAAYGSGSETEDESENEENGSDGSSSQSDSETEGNEDIDGKEMATPEVSVPPADTQVIIDKMADYVFKNGEQFEEIIGAKKDPRFDFLQSDHQYHNYYKKKLRELKGEPEPKPGNLPKPKEKKEKKPKPKKVVAPVSFSIKKPKEEPPKEIKSGLPMEESSDEESEDKAKEQQGAHVDLSKDSNPIQNKLSGTIYNIQDQSGPQKLTHLLENSITAKESAKSVNGKPETDSTKENREEYRKRKHNVDGNETADVSDSVDKEKRAEDKLKDKLAAVAREKLASVTREKALQLERKRKAAAFLKLKAQNEGSAGSNAITADSSSLSSLLLTNVKQAKVRKAAECKKPIEGNEPIFDDLPPRKEKKKNNQERKLNDSDSQEEETQERLENRLNTSVNERIKSSDSESSSGDCEIVEVSFPKKQKKRSRSKSRSRSKDRSRSKEKKRSKEKRRKRSRTPVDQDKSKRKREKKKKSHKRKHAKSSHESKHKKKSKKHHRSRSSSKSSESSVDS